MPEAGRIGDCAHCGGDGHGCPACPHAVTGPATAGSANVLVNGKPALRVGDRGTHAACCGSNTWQAKSGSAGIIINGRKSHRKGDETAHCGGAGILVQGSADVLFGDRGGDPSACADYWFECHIGHADGRTIQGCAVEAVAPDGQEISGSSDSRQFVLNKITDDGNVKTKISLRRTRK